MRPVSRGKAGPQRTQRTHREKRTQALAKSFFVWRAAPYVFFVALPSLFSVVPSAYLRLGRPDPRCDLDCTPLHAPERRVSAALVNAFAFGGNNLCLALRRREGK
jgi:hypothetical protein